MCQKREIIQWATVPWAKMPRGSQKTEEDGQTALSWLEDNSSSTNHLLGMLVWMHSMLNLLTKTGKTLSGVISIDLSWIHYVLYEQFRLVVVVWGLFFWHTSRGCFQQENVFLTWHWVYCTQSGSIVVKVQFWSKHAGQQQEKRRLSKYKNVSVCAHLFIIYFIFKWIICYQKLLWHLC